MRRLLILSAALGVLTAAHLIRSALRAVDGALEGVGRVPLRTTDGLLCRLRWDEPAPEDLFDHLGLGGPFGGMTVIVNPGVPQGKFAQDDGRVFLHPTDAYGGITEWDGPPPDSSP